MSRAAINATNLKALIARIERLESEKAAIAEDIKQIYAEAKASGFNVPIMRQVVKMRAKDAEKVERERSELEIYLDAVGFAALPLGEYAEQSPSHRAPKPRATMDALAAAEHEPSEAVDPETGEITIIDKRDDNIHLKVMVDDRVAEILSNAPRPSKRGVNASDEPYPEVGPQAEASHAGTGIGAPADREGHHTGGAAYTDETVTGNGHVSAAPAGEMEIPPFLGYSSNEVENRSERIRCQIALKGCEVNPVTAMQRKHGVEVVASMLADDLVRVARIKAVNVAVSEQGLRPQRVQIVAAPGAVDLVHQAIQGLDVGVGVRVLEVVKDQGLPALFPHDAQDHRERLLHLLGQQFGPRLEMLLGLGAGLAVVHFKEGFLVLHRHVEGRIVLEQLLEVPLSFVIQGCGTRAQQGDAALHVDAAFVVEKALNGLTDVLDSDVRVSHYMEFVDHDHGLAEVALVHFLVGPIHILRDDFDVLPVPESGKVGFEEISLAGWKQVQHGAGFHVTDHEAGSAMDELLVHPQHARHGGDVAVQPLVGIFLEDPAHQGLFDAVHVGSVSESPVDGVNGKLVAEPDRHVPVGVDARQALQQHLAAALTAPALALDPERHCLPLDGEVLEADGALPVLPDLGQRRTLAALDVGGRQQINIDNEAVTGLLSADGLETVQPQQVLVIQRFMPTNPGWRNLSAANIGSQMGKVAA